MIDFMQEMRDNDISELRFTMNGRKLKVTKATVVDGKCMEICLAEDNRKVKGIHPDWKIGHSSPKTQQQHIREYLEAGHSITPLEALEMFGCFRLGAQIFDLKKKGMAGRTYLSPTKGPTKYGVAKRIANALREGKKVAFVMLAKKEPKPADDGK